jgi:hypothetical protein
VSFDAVDKSKALNAKDAKGAKKSRFLVALFLGMTMTEEGLSDNDAGCG